jgi:hypothetical protein
MEAGMGLSRELGRARMPIEARYAIMVTELQSDREVELCRCGSNPLAIAKGVMARTLGEKGKARSTSRYQRVRVVDRRSGETIYERHVI